MSYLICLYVFYHGNNLSVFGFDPGKTYTGELNTGLNRSTAKDYVGLLPDEVVQSMAKAEKAAIENDYEAIFRQALAESQTSTRKMINSSLNVDSGNVRFDDFDLGDDTGVIGMDFFDEMNGMGSYRPRQDFWP